MGTADEPHGAKRRWGRRRSCVFLAHLAVLGVASGAQKPPGAQHAYVTRLKPWRSGSGRSEVGLETGR
eukprot:85476-Alexandrium_andersonii.AAC.1